jgi:hypothetical protein
MIEKIPIIKTLGDLEIMEVPEKRVMGRFNKDLLLNSYFEHTELFSPAAIRFLKEGKYCGEPYRSKKYNLFWGQEKERCIHGYENPQTKLWIPGKYYHFLNYKQMKIIREEDKGKKKAKRITSFPKFWPIHYFFSMDYTLATQEGKNMSVLKPRDTGFSELLSSFGVHEYTFQTEDPVFFFAAIERYLIKDGVLTKAWDQLDFHNGYTERAFKHLRQYNNTALHKRASFFSQELGAEKKTGGEIQGAVVDHSRKVRGARGFVNFEEGGSFPNLVDAWMTARDLAEQGGVKFAMMCVWGTGGEQGPGIAGLEEIFMNPAQFDCLEFDNCWGTEEIIHERPHGFFFPSWANMTKYMDKWGNTDFVKAKADRDADREKLAKKSQALLDKRVAEQPYTPGEALMRLNSNPFPVGLLQRQLQRVDSSVDLKGILKRGEFQISEGKINFVLNPKLDPVDIYPHKANVVLDGAITMYESPLRDIHDNVPDNLYYLVADCFYVDTEQATDFNSLGSYYVYKRSNSMFPSEDDILVCWYAGRPKTVKEFHRNIFLAARYYNAIVQTEIKGGGDQLLNYAKENSLLNYCGDRPTVFNQDKEFRKVSGRQFFVNIEKNNKPGLLQKLVDWLLHERTLNIDGNNDDKARYVLNLERIYDRALLEELIKFTPDGNFDRISCLLVLMMIHQEAELQAVDLQTKNNRDSLWNRQFFTGKPSSSQWILSEDELVARNYELHKTGSTDLIM